MAIIKLFPIKYIPITEKAQKQIYGPCNKFQKIIESFLELYPFRWTVDDIIKLTLLNPELDLEQEIIDYGIQQPWLWEVGIMDWPSNQKEHEIAVKRLTFAKPDLKLLESGVYFIMRELFDEGFLDNVKGVKKWLKTQELKLSKGWYQKPILTEQELPYPGKSSESEGEIVD